MDMDYEASMAYCQSKGGRLANIDSIGLKNHLMRDYEYLQYPKGMCYCCWVDVGVSIEVYVGF